MSLDVFVGKDTLTIDGNLINDCSTGKVVEVRYPNNKAVLDTGKDGNTIICKVENGDNVTATIRVLVGGKTDTDLSDRQKQFDDDPATFVALNCKFTKRVGDGKGQVKKITWDLQNGIFEKNTEGEGDTTGDMEQGTAVYNLKFARGVRTIS